jgi:colicin import membrane protein
MKRIILVIALLVSILFWGVNATAFAQDQVIKDKKIQEVKKDNVKKVETLKKDNVKKEEVVKKEGVKKVETLKKDNIKKEDVVKKEGVKKVETLKKDNVNKVETMKKDVKPVIKDKEVGKTDDGKIIYEGPKGGKYTLSDKGNKVYIKKEAKKEVK